MGAPISLGSSKWCGRLKRSNSGTSKVQATRQKLESEQAPSKQGSPLKQKTLRRTEDTRVGKSTSSSSPKMKTRSAEDAVRNLILEERCWRLKLLVPRRSLECRANKTAMAVAVNRCVVPTRDTGRQLVERTGQASGAAEPPHVAEPREVRRATGAADWSALLQSLQMQGSDSLTPREISSDVLDAHRSD